MPTHPRILLTTLPALALGACFDPMVEPQEGSGSATDGSTSEADSTEGASDTTAAETDPAADSTGAGDAPPVITAFTVDSSTMPAERQTSGLVAFDVDAMDDVGIDRIEIYDGDALVATVTEIPYVTEILLTSADNGSHSYTAIAYDTAGQTAESEAVPLSVNVIGGAILEIRENIGSFRMSHIIGSLPRVVIEPSDDVIVLTSVREDVAEEPDFGISAISYSETLSLLWSDTRWPLDLGPYNVYVTIGKPSFDADTLSWWTGAAMFGDVEKNLAVAVLDSAAETFSDLEPVGVIEDLFASPVALDSTSALIFSPTLGQLQKQPTLDSPPTWTVPFGGNGAVASDILVAPDDTFIVVSKEEDCAPGLLYCIYKVSTDGDVLWSRPAPAVSSESTVGVAISPNGNVAVAGAVDGPAQLIVYDANGNTLTDQTIAEESIFDVRDLSYDAQGSLVVAGERRLDSMSYDRSAWIGRFDEQGNPIWLRVYDLDADDHGVTGIATNAKGRLYAVGWSNLFEQDLAGWSGNGWVAELAL